jgi:hypothetical protein
MTDHLDVLLVRGEPVARVIDLADFAETGDVTAAIAAAVAPLAIESEVTTALDPRPTAPVGYQHSLLSTWAAMPAADTELPNGFRVRALLTSARETRLCVDVLLAAFAGATLRATFSTDSGASWDDLTGTVAIDVAGNFETAWTTVPGGAASDVLVSVFGLGGNGVIGPQFLGIMLQAR